MNTIRHLIKICINILMLLIFLLIVIIFIKIILNFTTNSIKTPININNPPNKKQPEQNYDQNNTIDKAILRGTKSIGEFLMSPIGESLKKQQENRKANEPRRIIGYQEKTITGKSWEECIKEYGRGRNELNEKVVRCQSGYTEKIPIYNK